MPRGSRGATGRCRANRRRRSSPHAEPDTLRYLHLIPGLRVGGAESHLARLLAEWPEPDVQHTVVSLLGEVPLAPRFEAAGVAVVAVDFAWPLAASRGLRRAVRSAAPDLLVGWMYHGNLAALAARRLLRRRVPVAWNIRATPDGALGGWSEWARRAGAWLSRHADSIAYNAETSRTLHAALRYDDRRATVMPNGIDTERFAPDPSARAALVARLGLAGDVELVGRFGRYHPMKGYGDFMRLATRVAAARPRAHFVLAGAGVDGGNAELAAVSEAAGLAGRLHLLGIVEDVHGVMAGLDVMVSTSVMTEAFPNVLAEAMACEVPCVTTDVGDSARVVGATGTVVAVGDMEAAAAAVAALLANSERRIRQGRAAREHVVRNFALPAVRAGFADLWHGLAQGIR